MALEIKQSLKLSQQLVMTPQLQQAIKLLQLNRMELPRGRHTGDDGKSHSRRSWLKLLKERIKLQPTASETAGSPEAEQLRDEESFIKPKPQEEQLVAGKDDFNWESYVEEFNSSSSSAPSMREINDELPSFENVLTKTTIARRSLSLAAFDGYLSTEERANSEN